MWRLIIAAVLYKTDLWIDGITDVIPISYYYYYYCIHKLSPIEKGKIDKTKHLINDGNMLTIHSMQLQKEVNSNPKQPNCNKGCSLQESHCEKDVKSKVVAKKWLVSRLMAKILIRAIQVNLVPNTSETWRRQHKFTWIVVIKVFAISLPSQPFLGRHLGFHIFIHNDLLGSHTLFSQLSCFGLDEIYTLVVVPVCISCQRNAYLVNLCLANLRHAGCISCKLRHCTHLIMVFAPDISVAILVLQACITALSINCTCIFVSF